MDKEKVNNLKTKYLERLNKYILVRAKIIDLFLKILYIKGDHKVGKGISAPFFRCGSAPNRVLKARSPTSGQ